MAPRRYSSDRYVATNVRVSPSVAASLSKMFKNSSVRNKLNFVVSPSQVHTDGKCEILVTKLNKLVQDSVIFDCVSCLVKSIEGNPETSFDVLKNLQDMKFAPYWENMDIAEHPEKVGMNTTVLDSTVNLSDDDCESIPPSPVPADLRKSILKRTSCSPMSSDKSILVVDDDESKPKNQKLIEPTASRYLEENNEADLSVVILEQVENSTPQVEKSFLPEGSKSIDRSEKTSQISKSSSKDKNDKQNVSSLLEKLADKVQILISSSSPPKKSNPFEKHQVTNTETLKECDIVSLKNENGPSSNKTISSAICSEEGCRSADIIIEKEVLKSPHTVTIIDSEDEDVRIDEVRSVKKVKQKGVEKPIIKSFPRAPDFIPLNGSRRKFMRSDVPETSSTSAPDFIPLNGKRTPTKFLNIKQTLLKHDRESKSAKSHPRPIPKNFKNKAEAIAKLKKKKEKKKKALAKSAGSNMENINDPDSNNDSNADHLVGAELRPVIIDANNVAMGHGRSKEFSFKGLKICITHFLEKGHKVVAFVPKYRRFHIPPEDRTALDELEKDGVVSYTPSRTLQDGTKLASYDDRFIVQAAHELGGVIVSTDNYRDLLAENEEWRETIEKRLLMFTWVGDMIMFPNDPLGRRGPKLSEFLHFPPKKN